MPLFMVKKEVFEWRRAGRKSVELRRGRARQGDNAVFQHGQNILRRIILKKEEDKKYEVAELGAQPILNPRKNAKPKAPANGRCAIMGETISAACPVSPKPLETESPSAS